MMNVDHLYFKVIELQFTIGHLVFTLLLESFYLDLLVLADPAQETDYTHD